MPQYVSRGTEIDTDKCVQLSGGNRFNLVIMASARARELPYQPAYQSLACSQVCQITN